MLTAEHTTQAEATELLICLGHVFYRTGIFPGDFTVNSA